MSLSNSVFRQLAYDDLSVQQDEDKPEQPNSTRPKFNKTERQHRESDQDQDEQQIAEDQYIDRAALRRAEEKRGETALDIAVDLSAGDTQLLGGSETTTHLVKGLDSALLARVRKEIQQANLEQQKIQQKQYHPDSDFQNPWARQFLQKFHLTPFSKKFAQQKERDKEIKDKFGGGRLSYLFDLNNIGPPVSLMKSRLYSGTKSGKAVYLSKERLQALKEAYKGRGSNRSGERSPPWPKSEESLAKPELKVSENQKGGVKMKADEERTEDKGDDIFLEVGVFDPREFAAQVASSELAVDEASRDLRREMERTLAAEEKRRLAAATAEMLGAQEKRLIEDEVQRRLDEEIKERMVKPSSDTSLPADLNPFSLKNASLMPLARGETRALYHGTHVRHTSTRAQEEDDVDVIGTWADEEMGGDRKRKGGSKGGSAKKRKEGSDE